MGKGGKWITRDRSLIWDRVIVKDWVSILGTKVNSFPGQCAITSLDIESLSTEGNITDKKSDLRDWEEIIKEVCDEEKRLIWGGIIFGLGV